jgi:predicted negative regulator of RcsB-dependent stress response
MSNFKAYWKEICLALTIVFLLVQNLYLNSKVYNLNSKVDNLSEQSKEIYDLICEHYDECPGVGILPKLPKLPKI